MAPKDHPEDKTDYKCPTCGGDLYDVTEYYELNVDTWACVENWLHYFPPEFVKGYWSKINGNT